ncbi:hypothetical protein PG995_006070 [Apiospora arundinis]
MVHDDGDGFNGAVGNWPIEGGAKQEIDRPTTSRRPERTNERRDKREGKEERGNVGGGVSEYRLSKEGKEEGRRVKRMKEKG